LEELIVNLGLRTKRIPDCIRYVGTVGKVRTLRLLLLLSLLSLWKCSSRGGILPTLS